MSKKTKKKITDFTVVKVVSDLCVDFCNYSKNIPEKYKFTITNEISSSLFGALRFATKAMNIAPYNEEYMEMKRRLLVDACSELSVVEVLFCVLNDVQGISNDTKENLDIKIYDAYGNIGRLINSLTIGIDKGSKYNNKESDADAAASRTELDMIEMRNCDWQGGCNA